MTNTNEANAANDGAGADVDEGVGVQQPSPETVTPSTVIDDKTNYEVTALVVESIRRVGSEIAGRVSRLLDPETSIVIIAGQDVLKQITAARALALRIAILEEAMAGVLPRREEGQRSEDGKNEGILGGLGSLTAVVEAAAKLLAYFRSETKYLERNVAVDGSVVRNVVAGALARAGLDVLLPETLVVARDDHTSALAQRLGRLARFAASLRTVQPASPSDPQQSPKDLLTAYDGLIADLSSDAEPYVSLRVASALADIIDGPRAPYLLVPTLVKAGGGYRVVKNILTMLGTNDGVSVSAGAVVDFVLFDLTGRLVADGDVIQHWSGNRKFPRASQLDGLSNVSEETPVTSEPRDRRPTPHSGDDMVAFEEHAEANGEEVSKAEAPRPRGWRTARSLLTLLDQIDRKAPRRSRASDGTIGDASHATRDSDHNPWVVDGSTGVVTAIDITNDPRRGCSAEAIAEAIRSNQDPRVKYIIWNKRIASSTAIRGSAPWAWRDYTGSNPHDKHVHISVKSHKAAYDSNNPWPI